MKAYREVEALAAGIEKGQAVAALEEREAHLCAAGLRLLADNERLIEVAEFVGAASGLPWHHPRVMRAAARIKLLFDVEAESEV